MGEWCLGLISMISVLKELPREAKWTTVPWPRRLRMEKLVCKLHFNFIMCVYFVWGHVSRVSCIVNLTIISNNNLIQTACTVSLQGGGVKSPFLPQEAKKQSKTVSKIFPLSMKRCWHYFVAIKGGEDGPLPAPPCRCHC